MKNASGQNQTKKQYDFYKGLRVLALTAFFARYVSRCHLG